MHQLRRRILNPFLLLLICAVACHDSTSPNGGSPALLQLPRALTSTEVGLRDAANTFSFGLFGKVNATQAGKNVFISPLSASFALGMTMNGAATITYDQMHSALQFGSMPLSSVNAGYKSLIALLTSLDPKVKMQIANSIWYQNGFPVLPAFVDTTKAYFGATVQGLNFSDVQGSLATINAWSSNQTNGKIPTILDGIDQGSVMFLINAIYFKGTWRTQFDPANTITANFTSAAGAQQSARLMKRVATTSYAETAQYQAVDLPYGDSVFTMTVLLPKAGTDVETLAASLTPTSWGTVIAGFSNSAVDLYLPKLQLTYERTMNADLMALGMVEPFDPTGADFTRMAAGGNTLFIEFVKQKTFVDINEEGTEAAAVTAVGVGTTSSNNGPVPMRVDHPYIFAIRERLTGTILFIGKIVSMP